MDSGFAACLLILLLFELRVKAFVAEFRCWMRTDSVRLLMWNRGESRYRCIFTAVVRLVEALGGWCQVAYRTVERGEYVVVVVVVVNRYYIATVHH